MTKRLVDNIKDNVIKVKWKGEYVWVAMEVAERLGYEKPSKIVNYFLLSSGLVENVDYITISQDDLREFKDRLAAMDIQKFRQSPKLILFYESGLVEFLRYRNKVTIEELKYLFGEVCDEREALIANEIDVKIFEDYEIHTLVLNGKQCWIAVDIAEVLGYSDKTKAVRQCIASEEFKEGIDYQILSSNELKVILEQKGATPFSSRKRLNRITVLYKTGLLGFINYAHMPIGKVFREWLRDEVFEELIDIEVGNTASENRFSIKKDNLSKDEESNLEKLDKNLDLGNLLSLVDRVLGETDERKLGYLDSIFKNL